MELCRCVVEFLPPEATGIATPEKITRNIFVISKISAAKEARGGRKPKSISSIKRQRFVQTNETVEPDRSDLDKKGSTRQD